MERNPLYMAGKKRLCILLALLLVFVQTHTFAGAEDTAQREAALLQEMNRIYYRAKKYSGYDDFGGYCGICVGFQLFAAGVMGSGGCADGNKAWDYLKEKEQKAGFQKLLFPAERMGGEYTLESICEELNALNTAGESMYAVFCFHTGTYGLRGETYGHVLLVHAVYNGKVFWKEAKSRARAQVESIETFCERYREDRGAYIPDGAVVFIREKTEQGE